MKKLLVALITVALFAFPVAGFCLDLSEVTYGVNGGVLLPQGDLDDAGMDMGYTIGGQGLMPSGVMDELSWGLCLSFGMMSGSESEGSIDVDVDLTIIEVLPTARFEFPVDAGDVKIFGQLGIGMAFGKSKIDYSPEYPAYGLEDDDDSSNEFGFAIGGGVSFMENFEAVALYKSFDDADYISLTIGYNFK
ncbi:MAG: porin family protein [Proteobacteria bacterium]|nr:porin family protein [Pseudomonadota bacterium]